MVIARKHIGLIRCAWHFMTPCFHWHLSGAHACVRICSSRYTLLLFCVGYDGVHLKLSVAFTFKL